MQLIKNKRLAIVLFAITALYLTWGVVYLTIRFSLESFPPIMLSAIRYTSAGFIFLMWSFFVKGDRKLPTKRQFKTLIVTSVFMIVIGGAALNISGQYINSGTIALIGGSIPLWVVVTSWALGFDTKPTKSVMFGLVGGFVGVAILAISTGISGGENTGIGIFAIFCSIAGWVAGSLYIKRKHSDMYIIKSLGYQMFIGGLIMFVLAYIVGEFNTFSWDQVTTKALLSTIHLIFFGSIIGYTCYIWLLYNTPTHIAISYAYVEPVVAVIVGYLFAGEAFTYITLISCIFIILSVFFVVRGNK